LSCCAPQGFPHTVLCRQVGVDSCESSLGFDNRVAELDEGIARHELAGRVRLDAGLDGIGDGVLQLESDALSRLLSDPGYCLKAHDVAERDGSVQAGAALETMASATFGPIPLTPRRWMKSARSAVSEKP
jgi:hypothetical protein